VKPAELPAYLKAIEAGDRRHVADQRRRHGRLLTVTFDSKDGDVPVETAKTIIPTSWALNEGDNGLQVGANGQVLAFAGQEPRRRSRRYRDRARHRSCCLRSC
jgi:hypothetical protein